MAQTNKEKIVSVPNVGVVAFPGDMEDEHVAAVIRAIRSQKAAEQAAQTHKLNRPMPLTTEESERRRQLKQAQPLSTAIPHLPAWLNTPSTELGRQASNWLSGEIGKAIGTTLPTFDPGALQREEAAQFQARHPIAGGVAHGISDIANGLTSPANMALLLTAPESKAMSALFALQALHGSYRDAQTAREAYREGNNEEATRYATESILGGAMGFAAGAHAVRPEVGPQGEVLPPEKRPAPEFPTLAAPMPVTLEGKIGGFGLPEYTESPIANYQIIYKSPGPKPEELNGAINDLVHARQSPGWNDPNASEHEARIAQQNFRDAANRLNRLQQMAVGQVRQLPSGEKVVYLTRDGLQDLAAGLRGGAPDPNYSLNGISIGPRYIPIITANLQHLQTPHAQELTKLLNLGTGPKGDVTVSAVPAKGETLSDALSRLREEINHGWQKTFTNAMGNHLPAPEYKDLNDAIPPAMSGYLYQNGYPENTGDREANRMRVLEASSKMMSSAPSEFGLTPDEVANYLFEYFDAVTREHGPEALDKLVHTTTLARNIKKDYANARYPSRGSQGQGTLSSLPAGGQGSPQAGAGAPGRGPAPVAGPSAQGIAADANLNQTRKSAEAWKEENARGGALGAVANALLDKGMKQVSSVYNSGRGIYEGQGSQYVTFETPGGNVVELRKGDHPAAPTNEAFEVRSDSPEDIEALVKTLRNHDQRHKLASTGHDLSSERRKELLAKWKTMSQDERDVLAEKATFPWIAKENRPDKYAGIWPVLAGAIEESETPEKPTMNQVRATKETARPSVQSLMAEALRRRPTQPTLSEVTKDIAARGASVVP